MNDGKIIISDAGPLIALARIKKLYILNRLFQDVKIPPSVFDELSISAAKPGAGELRKAVEEKKWIKVTGVVKVPKVIDDSVDRGEAEAITLAKAEGLVLLIDERRGRRIAKKENIKLTGTGAVLLAAKKKGIIERVAPVLDELRNTGYRVSGKLRKKILSLAEEGEEK